MIAFVWAQDKNGLIGKDGRLPWHLPNDLKFFKQVTLNNTIVMGRKTFEGMGKRLLPNRTTIVMTRDASYDGAGAKVMTQKDEVLQLAQNNDVYIIGGAEIFKLFSQEVSDLYLTQIDGIFQGDTHMIDLDYSLFDCVESFEGTVDEANRYPHRFSIYKRKM